MDTFFWRLFFDSFFIFSDHLPNSEQIFFNEFLQDSLTHSQFQFYFIYPYFIYFYFVFLPIFLFFIFWKKSSVKFFNDQILIQFGNTIKLLIMWFNMPWISNLAWIQIFKFLHKWTKFHFHTNQFMPVIPIWIGDNLSFWLTRPLCLSYQHYFFYWNKFSFDSNANKLIYNNVLMN